MAKNRRPFTDEDIQIVNYAFHIAAIEDNAPINNMKKIRLTTLSLTRLLGMAFKDAFEELVFIQTATEVTLIGKRKGKEIIRTFELSSWDKRRANFIVHCLLLIKSQMVRE